MADRKRENELVRQAMLSLTDDRTREWLQQRTKDFDKLMSYYRCAMMEIETKFNVLNEEYSL